LYKITIYNVKINVVDRDIDREDRN